MQKPSLLYLLYLLRQCWPKKTHVRIRVLSLCTWYLRYAAFTKTGKWDCFLLIGKKCHSPQCFTGSFLKRCKGLENGRKYIGSLPKSWMLCSAFIFFLTLFLNFVLVQKTFSFGTKKKKSWRMEWKKKRGEKESKKEKGKRKEDGKTSVILYAKCWPEAKCQQPSCNRSQTWKHWETNHGHMRNTTGQTQLGWRLNEVHSDILFIFFIL